MERNGVRAFSCPKCGAPIQPGVLRCEYCGTAVYAEGATEITVPALAQAQRIIPEMQARIKQNPYDGNAYYELGLACYTLQLYDQAAPAFEQAKRYSPGSALAHYFTAITELRRAELEILSIQEFRIRVIRQNLETALSLDPDLAEAKVYHTLTDALLARNREDYAGAIPPLTVVTTAFPKLGLAWKIFAACYFQVRDYAHAIEAGNQAWQLDSKDEDIAYLIGTAQARLHNTEQAQTWARRIAALKGNAEAWQELEKELNGQIG